MAQGLLVLNAGSSSIKFSVFALPADGGELELVCGGLQENIGGERPHFVARDHARQVLVDRWPTPPAGQVYTHQVALRELLGWLAETPGLPEVVGPRISALLLDADVDVRIFTVNLLGELRHEQVTQWLQQVLLSDREVNVVAAAIEVMAETGQPEHIDALRETRRRFADDPFIGFAADVAIERIRAS